MFSISHLGKVKRKVYFTQREMHLISSSLDMVFVYVVICAHDSPLFVLFWVFLHRATVRFCHSVLGLYGPKHQFPAGRSLAVWRRCLLHPHRSIRWWNCRVTRLQRSWRWGDELIWLVRCRRGSCTRRACAWCCSSWSDVWISSSADCRRNEVLVWVTVSFLSAPTSRAALLWPLTSDLFQTRHFLTRYFLFPEPKSQRWLRSYRQLLKWSTTQRHLKSS